MFVVKDFYKKWFDQDDIKSIKIQFAQVSNIVYCANCGTKLWDKIILCDKCTEEISRSIIKGQPINSYVKVQEVNQNIHHFITKNRDFIKDVNSLPISAAERMYILMKSGLTNTILYDISESAPRSVQNMKLKLLNPQ
jgi:hypothetical protein